MGPLGSKKNLLMTEIGHIILTSSRLEQSGSRVINQIMNGSHGPYWHTTSWTGCISGLVGGGAELCQCRLDLVVRKPNEDFILPEAWQSEGIIVACQLVSLLGLAAVEQHRGSETALIVTDLPVQGQPAERPCGDNAALVTLPLHPAQQQPQP